MRVKSVVAGAGILVLASCSNLQEAPGPDMVELFQTDITAQGLKQFTYTLDRAGGRGDQQPIISRQTQSANARSREDRRGSRKERERFERQVMAWLERRLAASGFCGHGYFIIDRDIALGTAAIRGECKSVSGEGGAQD